MADKERIEEYREAFEKYFKKGVPGGDRTAMTEPDKKVVKVERAEAQKRFHALSKEDQNAVLTEYIEAFDPVAKKKAPKVAAQFYCLGMKSKKIKGAYKKAKTMAKWYKAGFNHREYELFNGVFRYNLAEAQKAKNAWDQLSYQEWLKYVKNGRSPEIIESWQAAGITAEDALDWLRMVDNGIISVDGCNNLSRQGCTPQLFTMWSNSRYFKSWDEAMQWRQVWGDDLYKMAIKYKSASPGSSEYPVNWTAAKAKEWYDVWGKNFEGAANYYAAADYHLPDIRWTPTEAKKWYDGGWNDSFYILKSSLAWKYYWGDDYKNALEYFKALRKVLGRLLEVRRRLDSDAAEAKLAKDWSDIWSDDKLALFEWYYYGSWEGDMKLAREYYDAGWRDSREAYHAASGGNPPTKEAFEKYKSEHPEWKNKSLV